MDAYIFDDGLCCEACAEKAKATTTVRLSDSLQRLPLDTNDSKVSNTTVIGERVAQVAERIAHNSLTGSSNFQAEDCLAFALALNEWSEGALQVQSVEALGHPGAVRHVVAGLDGRLFLDSDGVGTAADLVAKMNLFEGPSRFMLVQEEMNPEALRRANRDPAQVSRIAGALRLAIGPFDRAALDGMRVLAFDPDDDRTFDSKDYPKGPYANGGGEADAPQNCSACGTFLENPLTPSGEAYVVRQVRLGHAGSKILEEWRAYYDHLFARIDEDEGESLDEFAPSM